MVPEERDDLEPITAEVSSEPQRLSKKGNPIPKGFVLWEPGQSGNPAGRPKMTKEEKELWDNIRKLGPKTYATMVKILDNERGQTMAKVRLIEIILGYILGKPESNVNLNVNVEERIHSSELRIAALVQSIKQGGFVEDGQPDRLEGRPVSLELPASDRESDRVRGSDEAPQQMD